MFSLRASQCAAILTAAVLSVCSGKEVQAVGEQPADTQATDTQATDTQAAKARDYVRLALQHGAHGKAEFRRQLLEAALLIAPDYALAHWHLGHVQIDGEWIAAAGMQQRNASCERLANYQELRDDAMGDPRRELALATWCKKHGWDDRTDLHLARVALAPQAGRHFRDEALRKLELVNVGGNLLTEEELAQWEERTREVENAFKKWRRPMERWRNAIELRGGSDRERAEQGLAQIDDPAVIPVLESFLAESGANFGRQVIALLAGFPQHESTETLVRFAVLSPWERVRSGAIAELKERPLHDYVPMLLDGLVAPIESRFLITRSPDGVVRYQHIFYRQNDEANYVVKREHVARPAVWRLSALRTRNGNNFSDNFTPQDAALDVLARAQAEANFAAMEAANYEQALSEGNTRIFLNNSPILRTLRDTSGQQLGADPAAWQQWWEGYNEVPRERPTYFAYYPSSKVLAGTYQPPFDSGSCFAAGTLVWTETGLVPIERVQPGDRVLSQDPDSGEMAYKVVLRSTAAPPSSATVRVIAEGEAIDMTRAHVVWVPNRGWQLGKELEPNQLLHSLHGPVAADQIVDLPAELEVYNLVVADFNTYFVGEAGVLVHDITYRQPTRSLVPGLTRDGLHENEQGQGLTAIARSMARQVHAALQPLRALQQ